MKAKNLKPNFEPVEHGLVTLVPTKYSEQIPVYIPGPVTNAMKEKLPVTVWTHLLCFCPAERPIMQTCDLSCLLPGPTIRRIQY